MERLFIDIALIWVVSILIMLPFARLKFHPILAFIAAGMLIGPYGLKIITHAENIKILGEIGIVLLLFTIGIEFSLKTFWRMRRFTLMGGLLQWGFSTLALLPVLYFFPVSNPFTGIAITAAFALSSTALVLNLLQSQGMLTTFYGRIATGILIFQDLVAVALMFLLPTLLSARVSTTTLLTLGQSLVFLIGLMLVSIKVIPWLLHKVLQHTSRETLLLLLITLCFGIGWFTHTIGLSLALGAFVAGLSISESDFNIEAIGHLSPFHSVFANFFFVSVGLAIDLHFLVDHLLTIAAATLILMLIKAGILTGVLLFLKVPIRFAALVGILLAQVGEFSLVLLESIQTAATLPATLHNFLISIVIFSMILTPFLATALPAIERWMQRWVQPDLAPAPLEDQEEQPLELQNHIIIVGFGIVGRAVAQAAITAKIPYLVIEANYTTVQQEKQKGTNILFGDASNIHLLEKAGLSRARIIALTFPQATDAVTIIRSVRKLHPDIPIIARSLFASQMTLLYSAGATEVICDELETGTTMFSQILKAYLLEDSGFLQFREQLRQATYQQAAPSVAPASPPAISSPDMSLHTLNITSESPLAGKTLQELDLSKQFGILAVGIARPNHPYTIPSADTALQPGDQLLLVGPREKIRTFLQQMLIDTLQSHQQDRDQSL